MNIFFRKSNRSLTWKTIFYILLFSSFFTILASALQLYQSYQEDIGLIGARMDLIQQSYLDSLSTSVWEVDKEQIEIQLRGILSLSDIQFVNLQERTQELSFIMGTTNTEKTITRKFPLEYSLDELEPIFLGDLIVVATLENVYQRTLNKLFLILVTQAVKTFCVTFCILYIIYFLITRHLITIAQYSRLLNLNNLDTPLILNRTPQGNGHQDELDQVVSASNEMRLGLKNEIIERRNLEDRLRQAQKMEAIGTLAGGIAHDFNNILGAILGYAEMVQEDCSTGSTMRSDIDRVVEASHRAKELVKQILAFSRQAETEEKLLQPALIIKEALKMLRASIPTTIDIQQNIDPEVGLVLADPTHIHQILTNLCTNALHAMEESGGTLTISLKNQELIPADLVREPHVQPGHFVEISVGDTGPGIAPEIIDKIFDPFFTTKEVGKGTGMGLAIIHGIAKKSGGFVSCKSSPVEGTTFYAYLPVHAVTAPPEAVTTPFELIQIGIERILFIDDEEMLAEMGKTMLERLGYRVTVETNSIEALKIIQDQPDRFDLVITDQTMPGMTGNDLARRILQIRPAMPIILCTGFSNQISEEKAMMYGIKGFAMKPLAKKDLAALIRKILDEEK